MVAVDMQGYFTNTAWMRVAEGVVKSRCPARGPPSAAAGLFTTGEHPALTRCYPS